MKGAQGSLKKECDVLTAAGVGTAFQLHEHLKEASLTIWRALVLQGCLLGGLTDQQFFEDISMVLFSTVLGSHRVGSVSIIIDESAGVL